MDMVTCPSPKGEGMEWDGGFFRRTIRRAGSSHARRDDP